MPLDKYDSQDAIPEDARDAALALADGTYAVFREEDVSGLKAKNAELIGKAKAAQARADELAAAKAEAELAAKGLLEHKQRWDADILGPIKTRAEQLEAENRQLKLVTPVKDALRAAGVIAPDDAWRLVGDHFDLTDDGRPILKDNPTADIAKWAKESLAKDKPWLFAASDASGGGATGARRAVGTPAAKHPRDWTPQERAQYAATHGLAALNKLVTEATTAELADARKRA